MRRALWLFILFLTMWAGTAVISHAIQCPLSSPWDLTATTCLNQVGCIVLRYGGGAQHSSQEALYLIHGNINIFTDLVIILTPFVLLRNVQIRPSQKRAICSIFVIRLV